MAKIVDSPKGGKMNRFEPGESGNPKGKIPGTRNVATILRECLEILDKKNGGKGEALQIPVAKLIKLMDAQNEAVQLKATQEAIERLEGKVEETINIISIPKIDISFRDAD